MVVVVKLSDWMVVGVDAIDPGECHRMEVGEVFLLEFVELKRLEESVGHVGSFSFVTIPSVVARSDAKSVVVVVGEVPVSSQDGEALIGRLAVFGDGVDELASCVPILSNVVPSRKVNTPDLEFPLSSRE